MPTQARDRRRRSVSVRLEGGLGDHVLGMRVLRFVRDRYPKHEIVVFSDSNGFTAPTAAAALSPFVSQVVPISHPSVADGVVNTERLHSVRAPDLARMLSADVVIDTFGGDMLVEASETLNVPLFDILCHPPELAIPSEAHDVATHILTPFQGASFVAMHLAKFGARALEKLDPHLTYMLTRLLRHPDVIVLNFFTSSYDYVSWPEPSRSARLQRSIDEATYLTTLCSRNDRILPCVDLPLATLAALLSRCHYFIGLDSGIKHLAWALQLPLSYFHPITPSLAQALRWMPDLHRLLQFTCSTERLESHISDIETALLKRAPQVMRSATAFSHTNRF
jgi:hypothetical protein